MHERRLRFTNYVEDPQGNSMDIDWTLGTLFDSAVRLHRSQDNLLMPHYNPLEHVHCQSFSCSITYRRMLATSRLLQQTVVTDTALTRCCRYTGHTLFCHALEVNYKTYKCLYLYHHVRLMLM